MGEIWGGGVGAVGESLKEGGGATGDIFWGGEGAVGDSTGTDTSSSSLRVRSMTTAGGFLGCESFLSTEHWVVALDADAWKEKTQLSKAPLADTRAYLAWTDSRKETACSFDGLRGSRASLIMHWCMFHPDQ